MFGIYRKKVANFTSSVVISCGIDTNQFMPMITEHLVSDWKDEKSLNVIPNPALHNITPQNAAYINHFYKPLKRHTKRFKNVEH